MVADVVLTPRLRWQVGAIGAATALVGVLLAWAGLAGVVPPLRAMAANARVIEYAPHDAIALPLSLTCFALAAMALMPLVGKGAGAAGHGAGHGAKHGAARHRRAPGATILFGLAVAGALMAVVISPILRGVMSQAMADHGYSVCSPSAAYERHPPVRFAKAAGRCP